MELAHRQPEVFIYRHKKFDQRKRAKHDSIPLEATNNMPALKHKLDQCDKLDTPLTISSDSNSSCDFVSFTQNFQQISSTPLAKRRRILPHLPLRQQSYEDSGIAVTPQKYHIDDSNSLASSMDTARYTATPNAPRSLVIPTFNICSATPPPPAPTTATIANTTAVLPKISTDALRSICKYHGNMVRKFPKKERTPKDQERRNKNTIACRMSRRVKKLEHLAIEEQYKEYSQQHMKIAEESMRAAAYLHELMKLAAVVEERDGQREKLPLEEQPTTSKHQVEGEKKKCFSIAFLMGSETN